MDYVVGLYNTLTNLGMKVWLDGGWGVDALLGRQTRPHDDVDIVIEQKNVPKLRELLGKQGYTNVPRDDTSPWNFVLGDHAGHLVDVHAVVFDSDGNGLYGPLKNGIMYPVASFTGRGIIDRQEVRCISPEHVVKFHTQYAPDENDIKDVMAICDKFGIKYPVGYSLLKK